MTFGYLLGLECEKDVTSLCHRKSTRILFFYHSFKLDSIFEGGGNNDASYERVKFLRLHLK
jgi:hypothetical protein